jgi:hypothetical protein
MDGKKSMYFHIGAEVVVLASIVGYVTWENKKLKTQIKELSDKLQNIEAAHQNLGQNILPMIVGRLQALDGGGNNNSRMEMKFDHQQSAGPNQQNQQQARPAGPNIQNPQNPQNQQNRQNNNQQPRPMGPLGRILSGVMPMLGVIDDISKIQPALKRGPSVSTIVEEIEEIEEIDEEVDTTDKNNQTKESDTADSTAESNDAGAVVDEQELQLEIEQEKKRMEVDDRRKLTATSTASTSTASTASTATSTNNDNSNTSIGHISNKGGLRQRKTPINQPRTN